MSDTRADDAGDGDGGRRGLLSGPLAWMARNSVAANIVMLGLLIGGAVKACDIKQEVFPEFAMDIIVINVAYPGASPAEVEHGVVQAVEEQVRGIDGVKEVRSTATEGFGVTTVELLLGADSDQVLNEVKAAVDRIASFPEDVERPVVFMAKNRLQVVSLALYGDVSPRVLKSLAEDVRDDIVQDPRITVVDVTGVNPLEISIEIAREDLQRYGLTLDQVAALVSQASRDVPAGAIKTAGGEVLLRTRERRDVGAEFADIAVVSRPDGTRLRLGDIADVKDGFADTDIEASYGGHRAVMINVFRVGKQTPIEVSKAVTEYVAAHAGELPPGVRMATWFDTSEFYKDRRDLLFENAAIGLVLVLLILGLFLEVKLAFWVTLGIPISFVGALLFLPSTGVSINMLSLFAFIVVLGMVVDDAIIVGEAVYRVRQEGGTRLEAAIRGVREVAAPVVFAVTTTVIAFTPMLFVPGFMGKFFRVVPIVVILVMLMSLVESLLILPAHLAHSQEARRGVFGFVNHQQQRFSRGVERFIARWYRPLLGAAVRRRYFTAAACVAVLVGTCGVVPGGRLKTEFFPSVEGDVIIANAELPFGTSIEQTRVVHDRMLEVAQGILDEHGGGRRIDKGVFSYLGDSQMAAQNDPARTYAGQGASHLAEISVYLVPADERTITAAEFTRTWRARLRDLPGVERLRFKYDTGPGAGAPINIELSHADMSTLRAAAQALADRMRGFEGAYDVDDGFDDGKPQLDFKLKPEARALGLTEGELARQLRSAFYGAEAVRQQRGRDEVKVYVRLPKHQRVSEYDLEELMIRVPGAATGAAMPAALSGGGGAAPAPATGEIPLREAAEITRGRSYTSIERIDGRRAVSVTAEVDSSVANANEILADVRGEVLPQLMREFPGLRHGVGGNTRQQDDASQSLMVGFVLVFIAMYALLAIAFRSYAQPLVVLLGAIPFGVIGAIYGHLLMGYELSLMSFMGIVALSGVVVNDSLLLVVTINRLRQDGASLMRAVVDAGALRFRPIILTSLTTFFGLAPMILETSVQAKFLIPMAISLGFGVIFATFITLLLVPAAYLILQDLIRVVSYAARLVRWAWSPGDHPRPLYAPVSQRE